MPSSAPPRPASLASLAWRELLDGKWILLDQYNQEGRRCLVALRCSPGGPCSPPPAELKAAWMRARGASLKEIAFDLGMSTSGAFSAIRRGCKALGVASPVDLLRRAG